MKNILKIALSLTLLLMSCESDKEPVKGVAKENAESIALDSNVVNKNNKPEKVEDSIEIKEIKKKEKPTKNVSEITSISELWQTYKAAKAKVNESLESGDLDTVILNLKIAGECALQLGRPEIASWQFNNIGHYSIQEFQKITDYDSRMRQLATMNDRNLRSNFLEETKQTFNENITLLTYAEPFLEQAQIIDDELEPSRRTATIERNMDFIVWVKNFTGQSED
jgi:hypothetical protein